MYAYHGSIARVNLTTRSVVTESFDEDFARKYIGGNGFIAALVKRLVPVDAAPLSPENIIALATGPFTATMLPGSGRGHMGGISPQTGFFFDSNFGGDFATALKKTGYDAITIEGSSQQPVLVVIDNGFVTIEEAGDLWGKTITPAHHAIMESHGNDFQTALIGPAGENGVVYSSVICSGKRPSAAGRGGLATVLGSKKCKGIAARGNKLPEIASTESLKKLVQELRPNLKDAARALTETGTPVLVNIINGKGKLSTRNNSREVFEHAHEISGEKIKETYSHKNTACRGCSVACGKALTLDEGTQDEKKMKMPEYESIYALGPMMENHNLDSLVRVNDTCDELGMDTISFGVTCSFLAECSEKGLVENDLETPVQFGSQDDFDVLAHAAAYREGDMGKLLAMGSLRASLEIGQGSEQFLYQSKGLEMAGHSARGLRHMGLGYAVATRGGSHHDARPVYLHDDPPNDPGFNGVPEKVVQLQNHTAMGDCLVICRFIQERTFGMSVNETYLDYFKAITGWEMSLDELNHTAERVYTLERHINACRGMDHSHDTLPFRVTHEPIPCGPSQGYGIPGDELYRQLDTYYRARGWDSNGIPSQETLNRLEIQG